MEEVEKDMPYYDRSGGGVTLSGGEVTCQKEFAIEIVEKCKAQGINTAIETNLLIPFEQIKELLSSVDLVMLDVKIFDNESHKKYTGVSNAQVLENLKKLDGLGVPFIVRTPLIPGVSDGEENLSSIASFIAGFKNLLHYELLNFNPLGASKYKSLSSENKFEDARPFEKSRLEEVAERLSAFGIKVKVG